MPKKPPQNAFYFFMQKFREEQRKKGINYGGMKDVADAAGPLWAELSTEEKLQYETMAKRAKTSANINDRKYTSQGVPFSHIQREEQRLRQADEKERKDIKDMVIPKSISGGLVREYFYVMDVNCYCYCKSLQCDHDIGDSSDNKYLIGESTILRFSLQDGIIDQYHVMVNPRSIPIGYASDIKVASDKLGLDLPTGSQPSNYCEILAVIMDYLGVKNLESIKKLPPPIFTMPDKVLKVRSFINEMCSYTGEDKLLFRIYQLDLLFFSLINAVRTRDDEGFPKESLALSQLKKDPFDYNPGLGCEHHERGEKSIECTLSRAKRWTYTILDHCCPLVGIELQPAKHLPADFDTDRILMYNEQIKQRAGPSLANNQSLNSSVLSENYGDAADSAPPPAEVRRRTHAPLRIPNTNFSRQMYDEAPEFSVLNFPELSMGGAGRGRGSSSLTAKMNMLGMGQRR